MRSLYRPARSLVVCPRALVEFSLVDRKVSVMCVIEVCDNNLRKSAHNSLHTQWESTLTVCCECRGRRCYFARSLIAARFNSGCALLSARTSNYIVQAVEVRNKMQGMAIIHQEKNVGPCSVACVVMLPSISVFRLCTRPLVRVRLHRSHSTDEVRYCTTRVQVRIRVFVLLQGLMQS